MPNRNGIVPNRGGFLFLKMSVMFRVQMGTDFEFVTEELAFHFAQSVKRNREQQFLFIVCYLKLLSITSAIQIYQNIYPSTIKLSTRLALYMFNLVWACPRKFRLVYLFLLINCVPNTGDVETQTMQTADCRLQTVQTVQTVQIVQTECYFFSLVP